MTSRRALVLAAWSAGVVFAVALCRAAAVERDQDPWDVSWMGGAR